MSQGKVYVVYYKGVYHSFPNTAEAVAKLGGAAQLGRWVDADCKPVPIHKEELRRQG